MNGLILQGGGSKGGWQAGLLKAISEITGDSIVPFTSISGISVGAINASVLAMEKNNFRKGVLRLENYWTNMSHDNVYDLGKYGVLSSINNILSKSNQHSFLFNNTPLKKFLSSKLDFDKLQMLSENKKNPCFLNIHSFNYKTGNNEIFTNSKLSSKLQTNKTKLNLNHVLASTGIPFIFPSTKINKVNYGDGGLKLSTPSQIQIEQGCRRIIGVSLDEKDTKNYNIGSNMFNTIFPDALGDDFQKIQNKNDSIKWHNPFNKYYKIEKLLIRPNLEIESAPKDRNQDLPFTLKHTIKLLGLGKTESSNILNYISFDKEYSIYLIEEGYKQGLKMEREIYNFLKP
jgi:NTE family protein